MFRRTKSETPAPEATAKAGGKGRPTPSRREAEAAAKARAKAAAAPRNRRDAARSRSESSRSVRAAMKAGDERYYAPRDQGPVRRFVRDFVDSRFSLSDVLIPLLFVTIILSVTPLAGFASIFQLGVILLVAADLVVLRFRLRRELTRRFPDEDVKGTTYYAVTRALQMKFMRLPKAKVKIGQELPEHYR